MFITRDPAGFADGPNLYTYVRQNPWTFFDPTGLQTAYTRMLDKQGTNLDPGYSIDPIEGAQAALILYVAATAQLEQLRDDAAADAFVGFDIEKGEQIVEQFR